MPNTPKLDNEQRMLVLRMFAEGHDSGQILREIKEKFNITLAASSIISTCQAKKHQPTIKQFRDVFLAHVREVPIANKRYRLEDAEKMRKKILRLIDKNPLKTKGDRNEFLQMSAELRRIESEVREEMEKKPHLISNTVVNLGDMNDKQLHARKRELLRRYNRLDGGGITRTSPDSGGLESEDIE